MPSHRLVVAVAAGGVLAFALIGGTSAAAAAPKPTPTSTVAPSSRPAAPSQAPRPSASFAPPRTGGTPAPVVAVPAGHVSVAPTYDSLTSIEIAALFAAGVAVASGGVVAAVRRRS